jgi:LVIVD repeat
MRLYNRQFLLILSLCTIMLFFKGALARPAHPGRSLAYSHISSVPIIDVTDPVHPTLRGVYTGNDFTPYAVQVVGNLAYAVGAINAETFADMEIIDVSDPAKPVRRGNSIIIGRSSYEDIADQDHGLEIFHLNLPYHSFLPFVPHSG